MNILITGGMGFIGANLVKHMVEKYPHYRIINYDKLSYASNPSYLNEISDYPNYYSVYGDICDNEKLNEVFMTYKITHVIHLAAESHVDNSILDPAQFARVNVLGTLTLLDTCKYFWKNKNSGHLFYHISTDEVYGSLGSEGYFTESTAYDPRSPYSASKASSDHFVRAYYHTYGLPVVISNCSNNYGPNQHKEKLIPLTIEKIKDKLQIPVYGDGLNVRDWLYVQDHVEAIDTIFHFSKFGETYNIGGNNESTNIDLINRLCDMVDSKLNREVGTSRKLITFVRDRLGHDRRYAIDSSKLTQELGWKPKTDFEVGLSNTIDWYLKPKK